MKVGTIIFSSPEPLGCMADMVPDNVGILTAFTSQDSLYGGSKICPASTAEIVEGLMGQKGCEERVS